MKNHLIAVVFSVASLTSFAQSAPEANAVIAKSSVAASNSPIHAHPMSAEEFHKFIGSYQLGNGETVSLMSRGNFKFAVLNDGIWHQIIATSDNSFVAKDRQFAISIDLHEGQEATGTAFMPVTDSSARVAKDGKAERDIPVAVLTRKPE